MFFILNLVCHFQENNQWLFMFVQIFMIVQLEPEEYTVCPAPLPQEAGHALQEQCISSTSRLLAANLYLKKNKKSILKRVEFV